MPGAISQVGWKIEPAGNILMARIATTVMAAVSINKDAFSLFGRLPNSGADPMVGSGFAILNCPGR